MSSEATPSAGPRARPRRRRCRAAALVLAAILASASVGLEFREGAPVRLQQFRTRGNAESGARWFLEGESAVVRGTVYELAGVVVRMEGEGGRTAVVRAKTCTYYQDSGLVESREAVRVESGNVTLKGVGFDMLMSERRLRVRDAVHMEVSGTTGDLQPAATTTMPPPAGATPAVESKSPGTAPAGKVPP